MNHAAVLWEYDRPQAKSGWDYIMLYQSQRQMKNNVFSYMYCSILIIIELIHQTPGPSPKTMPVINSVHFVNELQGNMKER